MASVEVRLRCSLTCRVVTTSSRCCISTLVRSRESSRPLARRQRLRLHHYLPWRQHALQPSVLIQTWMTWSKLSSVLRRQRQQQQQLDKLAVSLFSSFQWHVAVCAVYLICLLCLSLSVVTLWELLWFCYVVLLAIIALHMCDLKLRQAILRIGINSVNKHNSNVRSRCGPGNAHFIYIRQVSLPVDFRCFVS